MYNLLGLGGKGNLHASAFLVLAVLWMIQLFVTDSKDSCFLSVSIELRHADLLACMRGKIHFLVILSNMKAWIKCLVFWKCKHFWSLTFLDNSSKLLTNLSDKNLSRREKKIKKKHDDSLYNNTASFRSSKQRWTLQIKLNYDND